VKRTSEVGECVDELVLDVTGSGECLTDQTAKNATFAFDVVLTESVNKDQTYYFQVAGNGITASQVTSYGFVSITGVELEGPGTGRGSFTIKDGEYPKDGKVKFTLLVDKSEGKDNYEPLKETDSLTLTIDNKPLEVNSESAKSDTAPIGNFENCVIDGLVLDVTGSGECLTDQTARNATFTFDVDVSEAYNKDQTYHFQFVGQGIELTEIKP
jgi:hypothetical protein